MLRNAYVTFIILFLLCNNVFANSDKNDKKTNSLSSYLSKTYDISRLQYRRSNLGTDAVTLSSFFKLPNQAFLLARYDNETHRKGNEDNHNEIFEVNLGLPVPIGQGKRFSHIVTRMQKVASMQEIYSGGLQLNISDFSPIKNFFKKKKIMTFVQFFPLKNHKEAGREEILHYYAIPIYKKISIRGYNQFIKRDNQDDLYNIWADVIYPVNKRFDTYFRFNHRNDDDLIYGKEGNEFWLGIRINHSFFR